MGLEQCKAHGKPLINVRPIARESRMRESKETQRIMAGLAYLKLKYEVYLYRRKREMTM